MEAAVASRATAVAMATPERKTRVRWIVAQRLHNFIGATRSPLATRSNVDDVLPEYDLESK